jgi:Family of unknown function (DUF5715)
MRANAPTTVILALAALSLSPALLHAAPAAAQRPKARPHATPVAKSSSAAKRKLHRTEPLQTSRLTQTIDYVQPPLYTSRGRLIVPPPLKGSHDILVRQNQVADREGLDRITDDNDILELRRQSLLVPIPAGHTLVVDERLPADRRYTRPWTALFLENLSRAYYARFHTPLQVNSAVRTVEFQQHLIHTNGNAAPAEGETASPHLTGQAIDLAKHGLTLTQIAWLRGYLLPLVQQGKIDVEEEFQQSCFHISVYKKYLPPDEVPGRSPSRHATAALATAVQ